MQETENRAINKAERIADNNSNLASTEEVMLPSRKTAKRISLGENKKMSAKRRKAKARLREQNRLKKEKAKIILSRQKRIKQEELAYQKQQLKKQKAEQKHERKMQKQRDKKTRKERNSGLGGWIVAVVSLGISTLVLASILTFNFLMPSKADTALESGYQKAFFDAITEVNNMDVNLSKVLASSDERAISGYLVDIAIESELAERDIGDLPLEDESKFFTTKLVNQIGDFSKYLNKKITLGEGISGEDYKTLDFLYNSNLTLKNAFDNMLNGMEKDYSFSSMQSNKNTDVVLGGFNDLQNLSATYPELIYDGPFSDGKDKKEAKAIKGAEISETQAKEIFVSIFGKQSLENIQTAGAVETGIACFNVTCEIDGELAFAQISKAGGKLLLYSYAGSCKQVNYQDDYAKKTASEFLEKLEITGMKPVWINVSNNVYVINYAYEKDGVIFYPDMIKVRVCAETNTVIGLEATSYYANHIERNIDKPILTKAQARTKVKTEMEIETCRLAVIPIGNSSEMLCYEFSGKLNGATYYAYIDAKTGRQAELFKVVENTEGTLLM